MAMRYLEITKESLGEGTKLLGQDATGVRLLLPAAGGGLLLPELLTCKERYLTFFLTVEEAHSMAFNLQFWAEGEEGKEKASFTTRFGILGNVRAKICLDLSLTDAHLLFPEASVGQQKVVCHGRRIEREEMVRAELVGLPCFHDVTVKIEELALTDSYPEEFPVADEKLVDELGQNRKKEWPGKLHGAGAVKEALNRQLLQTQKGYPFEDWTEYGGFKGKKLREGTGFFASCKENGRWWLTDPQGYAFFSMGPDCVGVRTDCRVDGLEKWLEWLPGEDDPVFGGCYYEGMRKRPEARRECKMFSYAQANLIRAFGDDWYGKWKTMVTGQLKSVGMNTLGNWSDSELFGVMKIPYVTSLPEFPGTKTFIFRDFPDVFSREYEENAAKCAQALEQRSNDPYMIGYFLRNEPAWAFVDNLVLADEVLYNPERTACKEALVAYLQEKYGTVANLNRAWNRELESFDSLYESQRQVSAWSDAACQDMKAFSRQMLAAYVGIVARACRKVDQNHMILGMRWAWISDPDLVTGWENFDVFSINCYAQDPTPAIQNVVDLGVDLPVVIGEFHFGALDAGPTATGLEGVKTQADRGIAYRYYCERVAAHPNGVGCHYFQYGDQFVLGRFDGENYNIGLFDICFQPYTEMMEQVRECSRHIYGVADGSLAPTGQKAQSIPMIAY